LIKRRLGTTANPGGNYFKAKITFTLLQSLSVDEMLTAISNILEIPRKLIEMKHINSTKEILSNKYPADSNITLTVLIIGEKNFTAQKILAKLEKIAKNETLWNTYELSHASFQILDSGTTGVSPDLGEASIDSSVWIVAAYVFAASAVVMFIFTVIVLCSSSK
jgi:hypothetical protein